MRTAKGLGKRSLAEFAKATVVERRSLNSGHNETIVKGKLSHFSEYYSLNLT